nr:EOG090X07AI [Sida crystallina]
MTAKYLHLMHCAAMISVIITMLYLGGFLYWDPSQKPQILQENPWEIYGAFALLLYLCRYLSLLGLPQVLVNFLGLLCFNAFPDTPKLKKCLKPSPYICFRVVTRGDYPELVTDNVQRNINICRDAGLEKFVVEVVTDKSISLVANEVKREVVVPTSYATKSGAMFKARALQYCLEDDVNTLEDNDWIVHLDEETLLTPGVVHGIINFINEDKHQFGQGTITYANEEIVNFFLTLCDTVRVADDMGKIRFQLRVFNKPLFGWKGSFVVSKVGAERSVTFDNGRDSSVAEDAFFGLLAASKGYSFGFVEGEMWEKSPFTLMDFLQQRKRWLQGLLLVVHSQRIPFRYRLLLGCSVYSSVTMPLTTANVILQPMFPLPMPPIIDFLVCFIGGTLLYMYIYGVIRSFHIRRVGLLKYAVMLVSNIVITPFKLVVENTAVIWALLSNKHKFFVIGKAIPVGHNV